MKSAKFKDSPLGPIPQDWEVKRLGEIGEPLMCKRVLKHQTSDQGDIPFYKIGTFGKTPDAYITRSLFESLRSKYPFPRKGDCLISAAGTIGRVVVYNGEDAYFQDSNIVWIDNDEAVVTNEYLALCYALMKWQSEDGGIISRLYNANLKAQIIVCPPLPEQQRIAEALGEVDKLIESLEEQIEKKRLIAKGVAHDLLGMRDGENEPVRRLPGFKGKWERKRLDDIGTILKGSGICRAESNTGNIPAIRYGEIYTHHNNIVKQYVSFISEKVALGATQLKVGDVVFAGSGETVEEIGKSVAILDDGVYAGGDTIVFSPKMEVAPIFWGYLLNEPYVQKQKSLKGQGVTIVHVRPSDIAAIEVCFPKLAEQQAIAEVLAAADSEIAALEEKERKYEQIKSGMMHDLLTGKVRMKGE